MKKVYRRELKDTKRNAYRKAVFKYNKNNIGRKISKRNPFADSIIMAEEFNELFLSILVKIFNTLSTTIVEYQDRHSLFASYN